MDIVPGDRVPSTAEYLDHLLLKYAGTFNLYVPYRIGEKEYPAYGLFYMHKEKYVLVREVNMWELRSYEHLIFMETQEFTEDTLREAKGLVTDYMEPVLVRRGQELPEPNHMCSDINVVVVCAGPVDRQMAKRIRGFHFERGYKLNMRGFSRGNIFCVSLAERAYISNLQGREKKKLFMETFEDLAAGRPGFAQVMRERGLKPFSQENL